MTELELKADFGAARACWDRFWQGRMTEHPMVGIIAPRDGITPSPQPNSARTARGNLDDLAEQALAWARGHVYLGAALPFFRVQFGPDHFAALLGGDMRFHEDTPDTSWLHPVVDDWDDFEICFRRGGRWWERTVEAVEHFQRRCGGIMLIGGPTLQGNLDCLAALRGSERLLEDLVLIPDKVQAALAQVNQAYDQVRAALDELMSVDRMGSITRHGMYSTGRLDIPQCDFSCMISGAMFREFGLPALRHEVDRLDQAEYHLDGPDALRHLEAIGEIEGIGVIQWQPGVAAEHQDWRALRRRIDSVGKGQVLFATLDDVRWMWRELRDRRQFFRVSAKNEDDARRRYDAAVAMG